jgi:hypothetical protein
MTKMKGMNGESAEIPVTERAPDHATSTIQPEASFVSPLPKLLIPISKEPLLATVPQSPLKMSINPPVESASPSNGSSSPPTNTSDNPPEWLTPSWLTAFKTAQGPNDPSPDVPKKQDSPTRLALVCEGEDEERHGNDDGANVFSLPLTSPTALSEPATSPIIHLQAPDPTTVPLPPSPISSNSMGAMPMVTATGCMTRSKSTPPTRPVPSIPCSATPSVVNSPGVRATRSDDQLPTIPPSFSFSPASPSNDSNDASDFTVPEASALQLSMYRLDINSVPEEVESPLEGSVLGLPGVVSDAAISEVEGEECAESLSQSSHAVTQKREEPSVLRINTENSKAKKTISDADAYRQQLNMRKSKTLSIFRKNSSVNSPVASGFSEVDPSTKSNRVSVSLSNFTKSLGSKRPKSTSLPHLHPNSLFDASHLPPSPTLPSMSTLESSGSLSPNDALRRRGTGVGPRAPLSPTIHNPGSILMEAKEIGDAESRRLSEMAFLDM